jgi:hypothetical protein
MSQCDTFHECLTCDKSHTCHKYYYFVSLVTQCVGRDLLVTDFKKSPFGGEVKK